MDPRTITFVRPKHPVFNVIEAVYKAPNVVTGDAPETRHLFVRLLELVQRI